MDAKDETTQQHEITQPGSLLDEQGCLREPGWARSLLLEYERKAAKAGPLRMKEWDYYLIYDDQVAVAFTIADNSYMGLISASYIDLRAAVERTVSPLILMPRGKMGLPSTSAQGVTMFRDKRLKARFIALEEERRISFHIDNYYKKQPFSARISLIDEPQDTMVIATPWAEKKQAFYYNQKIIGMRAQGRVTTPIGSHDFDPANSFGLLDWGRGAWTYDNTWYWGAAQGMVGKRVVGFNIGYGFGDTSAASENMIFVNGKAHKLAGVTFNIPTDASGCDDYLSPWTFSSTDGRFEMDFVPIIDRKSKTSLGIILSDQHQVFGRYSGKMVLDDGKTIELKNFIGFAEKVHNKW